MDILVSEFEWDDRNLEHAGRHEVTPVVAEAVKSTAPKFFENDPNKTGTHVMIGPDAFGRLWTIVILRVNEEGRWRPITGWPSDNAEIRKYNDA